MLFGVSEYKKPAKSNKISQKLLTSADIELILLNQRLNLNPKIALLFFSL